MIAADVIAPSQLRLVEEGIPTLNKRDDVLLRVNVVGICGSDVSSFSGRPDRLADYPLRLGHEFSGNVVELGHSFLKDGRGRQLSEGMLVAVDPNQPCMACEMCLCGRENLCLRSGSAHFQKGGALAEYVCVPATSCFSVGRHMDALDSALVEPLAVALHVVDRSGMRQGDDLAIFGAGPIGTLVAIVATICGAGRVFVFDLFSWRLESLKPFRIDTVLTGTADPGLYIGRCTGGRGVDIGIEAAWMNESAQEAVACVKVGGRVLFVGTPRFRDVVEIPCSLARKKGLCLEFIRRTSHAFERALTMVENGSIVVREIVSHIFPLQRVAEAFELNSRYASGVRKVAVDISGGLSRHPKSMPSTQ